MTFNEKYLRAHGAIAAGGREVKRYHVSIEPEIEAGIQKAAAEFLPRLLPRSRRRDSARFVRDPAPRRGQRGLPERVQLGLGQRHRVPDGRGRRAVPRLPGHRSRALHGADQAVDRLRLGTRAARDTSARPGSGTCSARRSRTWLAISRTFFPTAPRRWRRERRHDDRGRARHRRRRTWLGRARHRRARRLRLPGRVLGRQAPAAAQGAGRLRRVGRVHLVDVLLVGLRRCRQRRRSHGPRPAASPG